MITENFLVSVLEHLAWPIVVLIAFFGLRKHVIDVAKATANIRDLVGRTGEIASLTDRLGEMKTVLFEIKEVVDTVGIKDRSSRLQELTATTYEGAQPNLDERFEQIRAEWTEIQNAIRRLAKGAGVKSNLIGTVNLAATVDELVAKGVVPDRIAEITKALSSQWQWMWRTTSPKEEWLNQAVFTTFVESAAQVKSALAKL